jgi:hypothetical protein
MKLKMLRLLAISLVLILFMIVYMLVFDSHRQLPPIRQCGTQLSLIGRAVTVYASEFNDTLPTSLADLAAHTEFSSPEPFKCPATGIKYEYIQGRSIYDPPDSVLVYCPKEHREVYHEFERPQDKFGVNMLFLGSYVDVIDIAEVTKLLLAQELDGKIIK